MYFYGIILAINCSKSGINLRYIRIIGRRSNKLIVNKVTGVITYGTLESWSSEIAEE